MSLDVAKAQKWLDGGSEARRVAVALDGVGHGFGFTEQELLKRTGLEVREMRRVIYDLQRFDAVEIRCAQVDTGGTYDYFIRLVPSLKVAVTLSSSV